MMYVIGGGDIFKAYILLSCCFSKNFNMSPIPHTELVLVLKQILAFSFQQLSLPFYLY
jgi:hypothetical protein